jgi:hypothetical protein
MEIYTVTTLQTLDVKEKIEKHMGDRTPAWFSNWEDANDCVTENWGDIYENGHFPYAVIEKVPEGLYQYERMEWWYKWDTVIGSYRLIEKPEEKKCIVGFGIG